MKSSASVDDGVRATSSEVANWLVIAAYCLLLIYWIVASASAALALGFGQLNRTRKARGLHGMLVALARRIVAASARGKLHGDSPKQQMSMWTTWSVPHAWFAHFYVVGVVVALAMIAMLVVLMTWACKGKSMASTAVADISRTMAPVMQVFPLLLFAAHVIRRLWESVYVFEASDARMSVLGYCAGMSYYVALPPSLCIDRIGALVFDSPHVSCRPLTPIAPMTMATFGVGFGAVLFVYGSWIQHSCHLHLASLRRLQSPRHGGSRREAYTRFGANISSSSRDTRYALPYKGWFRHVACPHYTAEIIVYIGLLTTIAATSPSISSASTSASASLSLSVTLEKLIAAASVYFLILALAFGFIVCNLCVAGRSTLAWYHAHYFPPPPHNVTASSTNSSSTSRRQDPPHRMHYAVIPFLI